MLVTVYDCDQLVTAPPTGMRVYSLEGRRFESVGCISELTEYWIVAPAVERLAVNEDVLGSNPSYPANSRFVRISAIKVTSRQDAYCDRSSP